MVLWTKTDDTCKYTLMGGVIAGTQRRDSGGIGSGRASRFTQSLARAAHSIWVSKIAGFGLFQVSFLLAYKYGMGFGHSSASLFWFPDSILLCALLIARPRIWWILLLSTLPVRWLLAAPWNVPLWFLLCVFLNDCGKALLVASVLRRRMVNPLRFGGVGEYALFCFVAVLLTPALSAFAGAAARHGLGYPFWPAWKQWFLGDAATHLIITPAILYGVLGDAPGAWKHLLKRWKEAGALLATLGLASYSAFRTEPGSDMLCEPACYAPIPLLFWAAVRFGMLGAAVSVLAMEAFAIVPAFHGHVRAVVQSGDILILRDVLFLAG